MGFDEVDDAKDNVNGIAGGERDRGRGGNRLRG